MPQLHGAWRDLLVAVSLLLVAVLVLINFWLGPEISFSVFYFLPVTFIAWYVGTRTGVLFSLLCATAWYTAEILGGHLYSSPYIPVWNTIMRLAIFLILVFMIDRIKRGTEQVVQGQIAAQERQARVQSAQRVISIVSQNVTQYNSNILLWMSRQREHGKQAPKSVEENCRKIGANLQALTQVYFDTNQQDAHELERILHEKLAQLETNPPEIEHS